MTPRLTVVDKLLLAAEKLQRTSKAFSAEDLVVTAWRMYPDTFGLSGYANQHPDSNRILTKIMGSEGLRGKGWLRKVGEKQYRLTQKGFADAEALLNVNGGLPQEVDFLRAQLERGALRSLERITEAGAGRKYLSGRREQITFADACSFWDISVRSNAGTLVARLADTGAVLESALARAEKKGLKLPRKNLSYEQLEGLLGLHQAMQNEFQDEINIIRKRTDERIERRKRLLQS
jgi:hypothetical protein